MLLPQEKEREHRFKLALRMGLPIFLLFLIVSLSFFTIEKETIPTYYIVMVISVFTVMIYYIFYLIYQGHAERITDPITHTFTREYLSEQFKKEITNGSYTIILISVRNLAEINSRYGIRKGDRVLYEVAQWIGAFLQDRDINRFPIGHYKGSDFMVGLPGNKDAYKNILDLMCLKFDNRTIDEIEIGLVSAIVDTRFSKDVDRLITRLFEIADEKLENRQNIEEEELDPSQLESSVIDAIKKRSFSLMYQEVHEKNRESMLEASVKLINDEGKIIHQNKFIPVIERLGLSRVFDEMIFEKIVAVCDSVPFHYILAFSLSASSVRNNGFLERAISLLSHNEVARGRIMFILNENEYYDHPKRYNELLQAYRRMGVFIAMDNYGAFKSNMTFLKDLHIDILRFNNVYGKHVKEEPYQNIINGLNIIAHGLGLRSWIRMIEDEKEEAIAKNMKIDFVQGNYFGKITSLENIQKREEELS